MLPELGVVALLGCRICVDNEPNDAGAAFVGEGASSNSFSATCRSPGTTASTSSEYAVFDVMLASGLVRDR